MENDEPIFKRAMKSCTGALGPCVLFYGKTVFEVEKRLQLLTG